jgi:hypothetical protein
LSHRNCLAIGKAVSNLPMVVKVDPVDMLTLGETKRFFK